MGKDFFSMLIKIFQLTWPILVVLIYCFSAYLSKIVNENTSLKWFIFLWVFGFFGQLWPIVAKYSNNLFIDAILYDTLFFIAQYSTFVYLGCADNLNHIQIAGFIITCLGILLMRIPT